MPEHGRTPEHHLPDALLAEYASGAGDPADAIMVACHATLCPRCRGELEVLESLGGAIVRRGPARPASVELEDFIAGIVARATDEAAAEGTAPRRPDASTESRAEAAVLPAPLRALVGPLGEVRWTKPLPGLEVLPIEVEGSRRAVRLVRVKPGARIGLHDHRGQELDLVLAGGLTDRTRGGQFERGDIQAAEPGVRHALKTLPGEPCLVLTVNDGPLMPRSLWARFVYGWLGWT